MNNEKLSKLFYVLNICMVALCLYFFTILSAKFCLKHKKHKISSILFKVTGIKKGNLLSLIEGGNIEKSHKLAKGNEEFSAIVDWTNGDYISALAKFEKVGSDKYALFSSYKSGDTSKTKELLKEVNNEKLSAHMDLDEEKYNDAVRKFLKLSDFSGLFKVFLKLKNFPTSLYYLLKTGSTSNGIVANIILNRNLDIENFEEALINKDYKLWFFYLTGNLKKIKELTDEKADAELKSIVYFLTKDWGALKKNLSPKLAVFFDSIIDKDDSFEKMNIVESIEKENPTLKVFSVVPSKVETGEFNRTYLMFFAIGLGILILVFSVSLFYLWRKYQANIVIQRSKDLEKMDALSIAKIERMEARKKRDKTELNVSSFVTLNIQLEVLDLAYTKLGLRVNPNKLSEQLEKTKIPNISYKIYTISNSYGLGVKMLSVKSDELAKQTTNGAVVLVLKGDLIALLKKVDNQNAYLQFSQKDSRKVPFSALKLSWEGNIILLNKV